MTDYYALLEVDRDATKEQIKAAFMQQALRWHPDKAETEADREVFERRYNDLQQAYKILSNDQTRAMYKDSQQSTFLDFKQQERDTGYAVSDAYSTVTDSGRQFEADAFRSDFDARRAKADQEALAEARQREAALAQDGFTRQLTRMETARQQQMQQPQADAVVFGTEGVEGQVGLDFSQPIHWNALPQTMAGSGLEEYTGQPTSARSRGLQEAGVLDDTVIGFGTREEAMQSLDGMFGGLGVTLPEDNPGEWKPIEQSEIERRLAEVQQDRSRLLQLKPEDFERNASEIETMYSGLFAGAGTGLEGLEAKQEQ